MKEEKINKQIDRYKRLLKQYVIKYYNTHFKEVTTNYHHDTTVDGEYWYAIGGQLR